MKYDSIKALLKLMLIAGVLPLMIYSCRTHRSAGTLTQQLFMQHKRVNIDYPADGSNNGNGGILAEQVTYSTYSEPAPEMDESEYESKLDTNKVYNLSGVTVASKLRFTSVREGHVNVDFVIHVPKELISDDYRIQLTPELINKDSVMKLENVVLLGKNFVEKQKEDYEKYDEYLKTIVPEDDYDKMFLDNPGINKDLRRRQQLYWRLYNQEYDRVVAYWKWRNKTQERYNFFNSRRDIRHRNMYHKFQREGDYAAIVKMTQHLDTVGTSAAYNKRFERRIKLDPYFKINREIKEKTVPKKYRDLFHSGIRPTEVENFAVSDHDSISVSEHRYFFDQVVKNEMKDSLKTEVFQEVVPYAHTEDVRYSITLTEPQDFSYLYTQEIPVEPGMKNLQVCLKGRIDAIDRTGYTLPKTDTLNYLISSLEELADSTLLTKNSADGKYRDGYRKLIDRDYLGAMKILGDYNDYNMALSLACQGYNQQAYALLRRQPETALTHYLNAIVSSRLNMKIEAVSSLEAACRLNTGMIYRCMRDAEIKKLIADYNLQERLNEIELTSMN